MQSSNPEPIIISHGTPDTRQYVYENNAELMFTFSAVFFQRYYSWNYTASNDKIISE
jgi:hypothetical protein